jgi:hypothetical protein
MEDMLIRMWTNFGDRVSGPMSFRLILQPTMAALLAIRAGLKDAREGRSAYLWTTLTDEAQRVALLREGWAAIARVFLLAIIMDGVYQFIVQRWIYLGEVLIVAILLAVVPYVLIRGPVMRIARQWRRTRQ